MARRKRRNGRTTPAPATSVKARISLTVGPDTPVFYVNFAEVTFTAHEFSVLAARTPAKLAPEVVAGVQKGETLTFGADIQLVIPPTLLPGLINALSLTKDQYEQSTGIKIKDVGANEA